MNFSEAFTLPFIHPISVGSIITNERVVVRMNKPHNSSSCVISLPGTSTNLPGFVFFCNFHSRSTIFKAFKFPFHRLKFFRLPMAQWPPSHEAVFNTMGWVVGHIRLALPKTSATAHCCVTYAGWRSYTHNRALCLRPYYHYILPLAKLLRPFFQILFPVCSR